MLVTIDIPLESIPSFIIFCAEQTIDFMHMDDEGPAGGNPRFRLAVHSSDSLAALGTFYWG